MTEALKLTVVNNSTQTGSFCIYQKQPESNVQGLKTLAWLVKNAHPTTKLRFEWLVQYDFVWTKNTRFGNHAGVKTSQTWKSDLNTLNQVKFEYSDGAYTFNEPTKAENEGSLYINTGMNVVANDSLIGIGMDGKATFLTPSQPNMQLAITPKKPTYWLVFGRFKEGETVDVSELAKQAFELDFNHTDHLKVEFCGNNTWRLKSKKAAAACC